MSAAIYGMRGLKNSMTEIKFIVEGEPIGKARPRFRRMYVKDKAGQSKEVISTYTPQKTVKYEDRVREAYLSGRTSSHLK